MSRSVRTSVNNTKNRFIIYLCFKVFNERNSINATSRVDHRNRKYIRPGGNVEIFNDPSLYDIGPRVDANNYEYRRPGGDVEVIKKGI